MLTVILPQSSPNAEARRLMASSRSEPHRCLLDIHAAVSVVRAATGASATRCGRELTGEVVDAAGVLFEVQYDRS